MKEYEFDPLEFGYCYLGSSPGSKYLDRRNSYKYENVGSIIIYDSLVDRWKISLKGSTHCLYNGKILSDMFARELFVNLGLTSILNKNTYPYSSYHEVEDRCPTCSCKVNLDFDMDDMGNCKNCRV